MLEKEVKILEIDKELVISKLLNMGAEKTFEGDIHDVYYDFVDGEKQKMKENKRLFRIRKKGDEYMYTIKRKRNTKEDGGIEGLNISDEGESVITNIEGFQKIVEKYGMKKIREKKKFRTAFALGKIAFDIDEYENIPVFMEIEAETEEEINEMIKSLGLEDNLRKSFGSRGLFKHYGVEYLYFE